MIGTGYVGLVVGACFSETGNDVTCVDTDGDKIGVLNSEGIPIFEPGLEALVHRNRQTGRLKFSTDVDRAVADCRVVVLAVGTPEAEDGSPDMRFIDEAAATIGRNLTDETIVIIKSTVPVGTAARIRQIIESHTDRSFSVVSNPEFLKEGAAVQDFMKPDRVIVGLENERPRSAIEALYAPFLRTSNRMLVMDNASAELTKYAANAMLATRISFMNEMANLAETLGADIDMVRRGLGSDHRIGPAFLFPGPGYGGSCFPKDIAALIDTARRTGADLDLINAVDQVNRRQRHRVFAKLTSAFDSEISDKKVAVWGLAFKAETDDVRESAAMDLVGRLIEAGARVSVHDPQAMGNARQVFGTEIHYASDPYEATREADALAVVTEWLVFRNPDFELLRSSMRGDVVVDARNLYDPAALRAMGFRYFGVGRP